MESTSIWFNGSIEINNQPIYYNHWDQKDFRYIYDLFDQGKIFHLMEFFSIIIKIQTNHLEQHELINAVKNVTMTKILTSTVNNQLSLPYRLRKCHGDWKLIKVVEHFII